MKWETIKKTVADIEYSKIIQGRNRDADIAAFLAQVEGPRLTAEQLWAQYGTNCRHYAYLKALAKLVHQTILSFDVRKVGHLRTCFPDSFPKSLRKGELCAYIEDSEDSPWTVEIKPS